MTDRNENGDTPVPKNGQTKSEPSGTTMSERRLIEIQQAFTGFVLEGKEELVVMAQESEVPGSGARRPR
jgi:hypothetical protein